MTSPNDLKFILILGSYDPKTKGILDQIKEKIAQKYVGQNVYPFLLDSTELYVADGNYYLTEFYEDKITIFFFDYSGLNDVLECEMSENVEETIMNAIK